MFLHRLDLERRNGMEEKDIAVNFEEVLDSEVSDIWDIFFPYMNEKKTKPRKTELEEQSKPRRYLKFLTICW